MKIGLWATNDNYSHIYGAKNILEIITSNNYESYYLLKNSDFDRTLIDQKLKHTSNELILCYNWHVKLITKNDFIIGFSDHNVRVEEKNDCTTQTGHAGKNATSVKFSQFNNPENYHIDFYKLYPFTFSINCICISSNRFLNIFKFESNLGKINSNETDNQILSNILCGYFDLSIYNRINNNVALPKCTRNKNYDFDRTKC